MAGKIRKQKTTKRQRPIEEDFPDEIFTETIKWRDLPLGVWEIINKKPVTAKHGPSLVPTLEDDERL